MKNQISNFRFYRITLSAAFLLLLLLAQPVIFPTNHAAAAVPTLTYLWHTFYGATDFAGAMVVDHSGNIIVAGTSNTGWGTDALTGYSGKTDMQVVKLDSNGNLLWHTFYGSSDEDFSPTVAVDDQGNVYTAGYSKSPWNGPGNQLPLHSFTGNSGTADIVVVKLDPNGHYLWHTFYGGNGIDRAFTMTIDSGGGVDIFGTSGASWSDPALPLHPYTGGADLMVLKLDENGAYQWHTFFGSAQTEMSQGISTDSSNNLYLSGTSGGSWGSPLHSYTGMSDITLLKLNSSGAYQWHTFYGSSTNDSATEVKVGVDGNLYIEGWSTGSWNAPAVPLHPYSGGFDILVMSLTAGGQYRWHTFYGSSSTDSMGDQGGALAVDANGGVYITGQSSADWGVNGPGSPLNPYTGSNGANPLWDVFLLKLNSSGTYQWHAFFGSANNDWGEDLVVKGNNFYSTGFSSSPGWGSYGIVAAPKHAFNGTQNLFVMKFSLPVEQASNPQIFLPMIGR